MTPDPTMVAGFNILLDPGVPEDEIWIARDVNLRIIPTERGVRIRREYEGVQRFVLEEKRD